MDTTTASSREALRRQGFIGLILALLILAVWAGLHTYAVFFHDLSGWGALTAVPLVLGLTWLYVGLFIVAHDCMHGSLVPFSPAINMTIGRLCLLVYAGFSFDALNRKHHLHHRHSGTADDPDFHDRKPPSFPLWYFRFFREYFSWREALIIAAIFNVYIYVLGANTANMVVFWALPAILSSVQLFTFGTYLPHRPGNEPFDDRHRARTNRFSYLVSLLTCFHFGYHHEHHLTPSVPWWRLPAAHAEYLAHREADTAHA